MLLRCAARCAMRPAAETPAWLKDAAPALRLAAGPAAWRAGPGGGRRGRRRLHQCQARLDRVVSEGDVLPHGLLVARDEGRAEQLDELVLHVLDEVEVCSAASLHHEDCEVLQWLLDACVEHADEDGGVLREVDHQLLLLLHQPEALLVQRVRVVEEQVVL